MLSLLPIIYRKPKQLNSPLRVLVEPAVPMESRSLCSVISSTSRSPNLSKMPVTIPLKSGRVTTSHAHPRKVLPKSKRPMRIRRGPSQYNQALYTPLAEVKKNFETLLSLLGPAAVKEDRGDISQPSDQCESTSRPVIIPAGQGDIHSSSDSNTSSSKPTTIQASQSDISHPNDPFRYAVQAADELLADLFSKGPTTACSSPASSACVSSNHTSAHQSSSYTPRFDLSDLPITPYRVPSS